MTAPEVIWRRDGHYWAQLSYSNNRWHASYGQGPGVMDCRSDSSRSFDKLAKKAEARIAKWAKADTP